MRSSSISSSRAAAKYLIIIQMFNHRVADDLLKYLAWNRRKRNWSIVVWSMAIYVINLAEKYKTGRKNAVALENFIPGYEPTSLRIGTAYCRSASSLRIGNSIRESIAAHTA